MWRKKVNQKLLHLPKIVYLSYTSNVIWVSSPYQNNWKRKRIYSVPPLKITRLFGSNFTRWNLSFKIISKRYLTALAPFEGVSDPIKENLYNYLSTLWHPVGVLEYIFQWQYAYMWRRPWVNKLCFCWILGRCLCKAQLSVFSDGK